MKSSTALHKTFWQNPFVDIFKHFPLSEKRNVDKQGNISEHHDKQIAKKVLKIAGDISGANFIIIPSKKTGINKSLGLNGRYLYLACMSPTGSTFSMHAEFKTLNKTIKLSLSNLFKTTKIISDTNVQVPFTEPLTKWSIICIDSKKFLKEILELGQEGKNRTIAFPEAKDLDIELVSIQLCAKLLVRGVYTSDNIYSPKTLPKDMSFRLSKNETFEQIYNWYTMDSFLNPIIYQHIANPDQQTKENKENNPSEENYKSVLVSNKTSSSIIKKGITHKTQPNKDKRSSPSKPKTKPFEMTEIADQDLEPEKYQPQREKELRKNPIEEGEYEEEKKFIDKKIIKEKEESEKEIKTNNIKFKSEHFQLEPNPIMALTHFQGFQSQGKNLLLADDNSILYSCGNTICLMDVKSKLQRFFIGQKETVSCLAVYAKQNVVVSTDDSDKNGKIYLWTLYPQTLQTSFFSGISNIRCVDIAIRIENQRKMLYLLVVGKDQLKRDVICLYDITDFIHKEPYLFCKKISDFDIRSARFVEKRDATQFITCGKESIRFWKLRHKLLNGTSLVLNEHGRDTVFNDFCVFNYEDYVNTGIVTQEGESIKGHYKVVFCSDKGNAYLVDYKEEIMSGIFKLHEGGIHCINVNPTNHYFITSGEDKMVRLWNMDVTQMLLEIKVDSQVNHLLLNSRDQILCGSLNGSIGELKLNERRMDFIVRSHCDSIIMMDYHPLTKNLITISRDLTIKVWELRSGHITQSYEFRCLDEQVSFIRCFHKSELFICGFESGSLRVFDLKQYAVVSELDSHSKQIIDIAISPDDRYIATADIQGIIHIYDSNLQFNRAIENDLKYQSQKLCFDYYSDYLLIHYNPNTIRILKTEIWNISYTIAIQEDIVKASFSPVKNDLFILTSKSQLKKCRLQENNITMEREYWTLHNGLITDFEISKNAGYIFTVGEDNLLKVWDYFMRGKLTPAFQAFTTGSRIKDVLLSNDNFNFIFSYGIDNNGIFCWQFYSDLVENVIDLDAPIEEVPEREEKPQSYLDSINERGFDGEDDNVSDLKKSTRPLTGMVHSIYHEVEDLIGIPSSTINFKDSRSTQQPREYLKIAHEEQHEDNELNQRTLAWETIEDLMGERKGMAEELAEEMIHKKKVTFNEVEQYAFNEENLKKSKKEFYELEDSPHKTPDNYKLPGQHLKIETVIGASITAGNASVVWNNQDNYLAYPLNSSLIISYLEEPKVQKHLTEQHSDDISLISLSSRSKYLVSGSGIAKNEASCNISIWDASKILYLKTLTHAKLQRISSIDISPCENYILVLGESGYEDYALLFIWEIQSGLLVSHTLYSASRGRHAKWNNKIKGYLEFTLLTEETITFWRLNHVRSLEYQEAIYDKLVMKGHKFLNINFLESKLFKDTSFMLVGTSQGALMIFDTRSNTLLFTYNKLLKGPVNEIFSYQNRLVLSTEDAGIYSWRLEAVSDPSDLAQMLEENPDILLVDSKPCCGYFLAEKKGNEGLIATKGGVFWYINWEERATVRLLTAHVSSCTVTGLKSHSMDHGNILVSSGSDGTVRVWDIDSLEQKSEFFVPRREALCVDIFREASKCVCGFSDGYVRFFDYEKDINYGGSLLQIDGNPSKVLEDKGYAITAVCFLKNGRNILAGNMNGEVYMIYVKNWENIRIEIRSLISNVGFAINYISLSELEPWDTWALSTKNRKAMVWNRKDLSFGKKDMDYYDKIFEKINNLEYYLIDNYRVQKKDEKELNYENLEAEQSSNNKYEYSGDTIAKFVSNKPDLYVVITNQLNEIFFRDYKEHLIIKTLKIHGIPRSFFLREKDNEIIIGTQDGFVRFLDYELGLEKDTVSIGANGIMNLEICIPKKMEFSMSTLRLEPVRGKSRTLVCSSRNGILIGKLGS